MQRSTFKVLFYVKRQSEKSGQVPIMGRITINGTMSQFSCKLTVRSSLWDAKAKTAPIRAMIITANAVTALPPSSNTNTMSRILRSKN